MASDTSRDPGRSEREERRAAPRRTIDVDARVTYRGGELHGSVVNMSFGGAKFVTRTLSPLLALGAEVTLWVADADDGARELSWRGAVVRSERSGDDGPERIAYAIAFDTTAL